MLLKELMMSKDIKTLLAQKLADNNARHANANQSTYLDVGNELKRLPLDKIKSNPFQPRTVFDETEIANLAEHFGIPSDVLLGREPLEVK